MPIEPALTFFYQLGVTLDRRSSDGTQAIGNCPFCFKDNHFHSHTTNILWDCKFCGRSGNRFQFLDQIIPFYQKKFTGKAADILSENRSISIQTLNKWNVGYIPYNQNYLIPALDEESKSIGGAVFNLSQKHLRNLSSISSQLYGAHLLKNEDDEIWLAEGQWDGMVLSELQLNVLAVPGANTFPDRLISYCKNKNVIIAFDHDSAGEAGILKAVRYLNGIAKSISYVKWPVDSKPGYDLRDFYKENKHENS